MHSLICLGCGKAFRAAYKTRKYCSRACAWASPLRVAGNPQNKPKARPVKTCEACGKQFQCEALRLRETNRFCSQACAARHIGRRTIKAAQAANPPRKDPARWTWRTCPTCGKQFETRLCKSGTSHCGMACARNDPALVEARVRTRRENGGYDADRMYSRSKRGVRRGQFFRSRMEANYAAYLDFLGVKWQYEPKTFWFPVKRGVVSYTPDFYLPDEDRYIETKGYMDAKSKTKIKRMAIHHPTVKLEVVDWATYREIAKWAKAIPGWETDEDVG